MVIVLSALVLPSFFSNVAHWEGELNQYNINFMIFQWIIVYSRTDTWFMKDFTRNSRKNDTPYNHRNILVLLEFSVWEIFAKFFCQKLKTHNAFSEKIFPF